MVKSIFLNSCVVESLLIKQLLISLIETPPSTACSLPNNIPSGLS